MESNVILQLSLQYVLLKLEENVLDRIIQEELTTAEKIKIIGSIDIHRAKIILEKIGLTPEFLKTIE